MTEVEWLACDNPSRMLWRVFGHDFRRRPGGPALVVRGRGEGAERLPRAHADPAGDGREVRPRFRGEWVALAGATRARGRVRGRVVSYCQGAKPDWTHFGRLLGERFAGVVAEQPETIEPTDLLMGDTLVTKKVATTRLPCSVRARSTVGRSRFQGRGGERQGGERTAIVPDRPPASNSHRGRDKASWFTPSEAKVHDPGSSDVWHLAPAVG